MDEEVLQLDMGMKSKRNNVVATMVKRNLVVGCFSEENAGDLMAGILTLRDRIGRNSRRQLSTYQSIKPEMLDSALEIDPGSGGLGKAEDHYYKSNVFSIARL
ncbi:hypothetical protein RvY_06037 [Ramazzottius varieornatus]|uniref:Uncharacterized protein n=1 Tax=Ramazzottius varieornatus TaxID=947166 RepID=A0A1D1V047_RAMVA|nr:hypothetical protein RvY_06037 [Ramazzottius varieornatus]